MANSKSILKKRSWRLAATLALLPSFAAMSACGSGPPRATGGKWTLASEGTGEPFTLDGTFILSGGQDGWFRPRLELADLKGCPLVAEMEAIYPFTMKNPENFKKTLHQELGAKGPFARAKMLIIYRPEDAALGDSSSEQTVFEEEQVFVPSVKPAAAQDCVKQRGAETGAERKARLREKAKTDPDGADAEAIDNMGRNELVATAINSAGFLCARVTDMYPSGGSIIVSCVEYRNGDGRAKYRVDPQAGSVEQL